MVMRRVWVVWVVTMRVVIVIHHQPKWMVLRRGLHLPQAIMLGVVPMLLPGITVFSPIRHTPRHISGWGGH